MKRLFLYACLLVLTQCAKCKQDDPKPEPTELEKLPPATQTGANTFGCLVNGQAFTPQGNISMTQRFSFSYNPIDTGGSCSLYAHRVSTNQQEIITMRIAPMFGAGTYSFDLAAGPGDVSYENNQLESPCRVYSYSGITYRRGTLTFTRLDAQARIAAGTFEVSFARAGCDTVRLTQGRFDVKF